ncbi:MAG: hypothetical protein AB2799_19000 [Candidatus Thiodiazotropha sp.]
MDLEQRFHELREQSKKCAEAKAQMDYLEEFKKSKLAILMKQYEPDYPTAAAQEREARADKKYLELLEGLKAARAEYETERWSLKIAEMRFEAWRSKQATNRAEMQMR